MEKIELKDQELNQRIVQLIKEGETKYRCDHWMNAIIQWICLILLTVSLIGLVYDVAWIYPKYRANEQRMMKQIQHYKEERKKILNGEIVADTADFDQILKDKVSKLKDFPQEEEIYQIKVGSFDSEININRNNIFVSDNANILEQQTKDEVYQLNKKLTVASDGAQLEIVTVSSLPYMETIESYANKIFNKLGIGDSEKNNGALYLIAINNREFRLEVGDGLEGILADKKADNIIHDEEVIHLFRIGKYDEGIRKVAQNIYELMSSKTILVDAQMASLKTDIKEQKESLLKSLGIKIGVIFVMLFFWWIFRRAGKRLTQLYQWYFKVGQRFDEQLGIDKKKEILVKMEQTDYYYFILAQVFIVYRTGQINAAIRRGEILYKYPDAKKKMERRTVLNDDLFSEDEKNYIRRYGRTLGEKSTSNESSHSSWGDFGGGSSGGKGSSGSW